MTTINSNDSDRLRISLAWPVLRVLVLVIFWTVGASGPAFASLPPHAIDVSASTVDVAEVGPSEPEPATPPSAWAAVLSTLRLSFFDAENARTYTAVGPFEVLSHEVGELIVRGAAIDGNAAPRLTIRRIDSKLWVFARFDRVEFIAQIE